METEAAAQHESQQPKAVKLRRSGRKVALPLRSYSPRVCFLPPARKGGKYHLILCNKKPEGCVYASIEFALGMGMKGEACCTSGRPLGGAC